MSDRIQILADAIATIAEDGYTAAGKPKVEALEAAAGISDVSAAERDDAFALYQAQTSTEQPAAAPESEKTETETLTIADIIKAKRAEGMKI
ncbi:MAG: hypothetical protein Tsb0017_27490 [Geothermobacteraceae bacterium]